MKDIDIRDALQRTTLKKFYLDAKSRVIPELDICNGEARIDIAVVNGHLHGLEIKSEQDTLARLERQADVYSKVFDYLVLVVAKSHIEAAQKILPSYWGITQAAMQKSVALKVVRTPRINRNVQSSAICQFLWKPELVSLALQNGISHIPAKMTKVELCNILSESVKSTALAKAVRETLKARTTWRASPPLRQNGDSFRQKPNWFDSQALSLF